MSRLEVWICAWISIAEGLLQVLSFTLIPHPWWTFKYTAWAAKRNMEKKIKENPPQNY